MLTIDLSGITVVVTAATSPLGRAIARRFAEAGADVVAHHRRAEPPTGLVESLPGTGRHRAARAELTDVEQVGALFAGAASDHPLGVLVNNAGAYPVTPLDDMSLEEWRRVVAANLDTAFVCLQAAARHMVPGGAIVNVASLSAHRPAPDQSHYNASKAGVIGLTRAAAVELAPRGIRVNSVSPGLVHRDGIERDWPEGVRRWTSRAPLARLGEPVDVADACVFLASPMSSWITGHDLVVDGGITNSPAY